MAERVGVVLGAGGLVGLGFHVHALRRLRETGVVDVAEADVIVGTSAGALVAALLTSGVSVDSLADAVAPDAQTPLADALRPLLGLRANALAGLKRPTRIPKSVGERHRRAALWSTTLFAEADRPATAYADGFAPFLPADWPGRLHVCTLAETTGERAIWHAHRHAHLPTVVAASCAVPGIFAPVEINGERHVDGGFWSPTNADVLTGRHLDHLVVLAPMSAPPRSLPATPDHALRVALHSLLAQELRQLRGSVGRITVIEPNRAVRHAMGANFMAADRIPAIGDAVRFGPID